MRLRGDDLSICAATGGRRRGGTGSGTSSAIPALSWPTWAHPIVAARRWSGIRRYDADALVELIRIRTLAQAGVPLARVGEPLRADPREFGVAIAEIDERLRAEIEQRQRHRDRIARLRAGDGPVLPVQTVALLEQLRALGVDERIVRIERGGWIPRRRGSPHGSGNGPPANESSPAIHG
ncbi:hypothetical protein AB0L57_18150 [Nocardia sp. NPDC052254]|uniref:hypothetical protein n=1 Tax=Nocardia sp. NPDC052254 TaxID=3155681 RepID=UPI00343E8231